MEFFKLKHLVYPADRNVIVTAFCYNTDLLANIEAGYISGNGCHQDGSMPESLRNFEPLAFNICGNILEFELYLAGEGVHTIKLQYENCGEMEYGYLEFYSLYEDLFSLTPCKGNFHCHTIDSDGLNTPQNALCVAREAGFDFVGFSEHRLFSDHADDCSALIESLGIKLVHAEEVHSLPKWICHILSFGADSCISGRQDDEQYQSDVSAAMENYPELSDEYRRYAAQAEVILRYISEAGGVGIMCHPYWKHTGRYNVHFQLAEIFCKKLPFEAMELVTSDNVNTSISNAMYHEILRNGRDLPVLAGSDWHGQNGERMEQAYNIIFSASCDEKSIAEAIRSKRCAAVFGEERPLVFGEFRMVNYALFLLRNYYSVRDALCEQLGLLSLCSLNGDTSCDGEISRLRAAVDLQNMMLKLPL